MNTPAPFAATAIPIALSSETPTMPRPVRPSNRCGWVIAVLPCLLLAGCGGDEGVKTYRVAAPDDKGQKANPGDTGNNPEPVPVPTGPDKVRFLGAAIPAGDGTNYFVRFWEPFTIEKIDPLEKDFDAFLNSIRVPGEGGKAISWTVPPGWKEVPTPPKSVGFRLVTIQKADGSSPDLYISTATAGSLLSNVNRWRTDFVGIPAVTEAQLPGVVKEIQLGGIKAYRVDFRGPGGKGGAMPRFPPK